MCVSEDFGGVHDRLVILGIIGPEGTPQDTMILARFVSLGIQVQQVICTGHRQGNLTIQSFSHRLNVFLK